MRSIFIILFSVCVFAFGASAQNSGIQFEQDTAWKHVLKKARKADKLVFIDCYTSWCGPCKRLAQNVFPNDTVGAFFNEHFINVQYDMEKDSVGVMIKNKFGVRAFPTLLFIDPETGELEHKVVGYCDTKLLVEEGEQAIHPEESLRALRERFANGDRDMAFLRGYMLTAMYAREQEETALVTKEYLERLPIREWKDKMNWHLIKNTVNDPFSTPVRSLMDSLDYACDQIGKENVDGMLRDIFHYWGYEYASWKPESGKPFDEVRLDTLVSYLSRFDHPEAPAELAYLYTARRMHEKDYQGMLDEMRTAFRYNVFRAGGETTYFHLFMDQLSRCTDPAILQQGIEWVDQEFARTDDLILKSNLMKRKGNLLKAKGDTAAAEEAFAQEKQYMDQWNQERNKPRKSNNK